MSTDVMVGFLPTPQVHVLAHLNGTPFSQGEYEMLLRDLAAAQERVRYVEGIGIRFGMMQSSDKPAPYLAHVWDKNSDHKRMFEEWSHSIGWEETVAKKDAELAAVRAALFKDLDRNPDNTTTPHLAIVAGNALAELRATVASQAKRLEGAEALFNRFRWAIDHTVEFGDAIDSCTWGPDAQNNMNLAFAAIDAKIKPE